MGGARFPRRLRLRSAAAYRRVFEQARRSSDSCFTVLARPNDVDHARLGLAISRRALKSATARNRVKRIARESFRSHSAALAGHDIVVIGRALAGCDNRRLRSSLDQHFKDLSRHAPNSNQPAARL